MVSLIHSPFSRRQTTPVANFFDPLALFAPTDHTPSTILLTHSTFSRRQTTPRRQFLWVIAGLLLADVLFSLIPIFYNGEGVELVKEADGKFTEMSKRMRHWITMRMTKRIRKAYPKSEKIEKVEKRTDVFAYGCGFYKVVLLFFNPSAEHRDRFSPSGHHQNAHPSTAANRFVPGFRAPFDRDGQVPYRLQSH